MEIASFRPRLLVSRVEGSLAFPLGRPYNRLVGTGGRRHANRAHWRRDALRGRRFRPADSVRARHPDQFLRVPAFGRRVVEAVSLHRARSPWVRRILAAAVVRLHAGSARARAAGIRRARWAAGHHARRSRLRRANRLAARARAGLARQARHPDEHLGVAARRRPENGARREVHLAAPSAASSTATRTPR